LSTTNNNNATINTVLIVNPSSSRGSTGKNWDDLYSKIKEIFRENPEVAFSKKYGDGTTLAREYLKKGYKNIIAIGGDGTINEVANGFFFFEEENDDGRSLRQVNPEAVLGIVSAGTRNVLAKSLNLPNGVIESCQHFAAGKPQKMDVIIATVTNNSSNEKPSTKQQTQIFLNAAEIGVAAEIIDRSKKIRDKVNNRIVSTVSSVVATLPTYESNLCEISIDDGRENIITKMTMCVVANGKYLGGGFVAAPQASVSDGLLDILILKNSGSFKMLKEFISMKKNNGVNYSSEQNDIFYMKAKQVSIKLKDEEKNNKRDVTVTVDGEPIGILPATFRIYQNALIVKM
jgi:YegS/Rv2252/BmrU family lipid kinase